MLSLVVLLQDVFHLGAQADNHVNLREENDPKHHFVMFVCLIPVGKVVAASFIQLILVLTDPVPEVGGRINDQHAVVVVQQVLGWL